MFKNAASALFGDFRVEKRLTVNRQETFNNKLVMRSRLFREKGVDWLMTRSTFPHQY